MSTRPIRAVLVALLAAGSVVYRKAKELGASETMKRMSDNKDVVVTTQKENPAIAEEQRMRGMLQDQPHWAPFYIDLATILKKGSRLEEAEATLKRGIVQCSADKRLLLELAHLEKMILTKRLEEIKEVVREDSQWPYAKVASDSIEIEQRRRDSEVLRLRTEADPGNTEAFLRASHPTVAEIVRFGAAAERSQRSDLLLAHSFNTRCSSGIDVTPLATKSTPSS